MNVGLVTFFQDDNVGTCLQAFALQKKIQELGHQVEILDYSHQDIVRYDKSFRNRIRGIVKTYGNKNMFYYKKLKKIDYITKERFCQFRRENLAVTKKKYSGYSELEEGGKDYDAFVCGSDMIWTPTFDIDHKVYFLQFCNCEKRISYAPSFGTDVIPSNLEKEFRNYIRSFPYISCREDSGIEIIRKLADIQAELVLDPTQLISKEEWESNFAMENKDEKYILCYLFGASREVTKWYHHLAKKIAGHYKANIRYMPMSRSEQVHEIYYGDASYGPVEFMRLVHNAEFIITNSYHGFMFSLIFEKPFVVVRREKELYWSQFEKRFESVLKLIHQEERLLAKDDFVGEQLYSIDYSVINESLEEQRKKSEAFLKNALCGIEGKDAEFLG